jgi:hypothetical protein
MLRVSDVDFWVKNEGRGEKNDPRKNFPVENSNDCGAAPGYAKTTRKDKKHTRNDQKCTRNDQKMTRNDAKKRGFFNF